MMNFQLLTATLVLTSILNIPICNSQTPTFEWAVTSGGASSQIRSTRVLTDAANNVFVTGSYNGTVDFDPGASVYNSTSAGQQDAYLIKFDPLGNFLWVKTFGGIDSEGVEDMHFDSQGNIILVGYFTLTVDFDPGSGITNVSSNSGYSDIFILKLTSSGIFTFVKTVGGVGQDEAFAIEIDNLDNIYFTGQFVGNVDFDPSAIINNLNSVTNGGIYVCKFNSSGDYVWAKNFRNQGVSGTGTDGVQDFGFSLCVDNNYNVHIVGHFKYNVDFDPSGSSYILISTPTSWTNMFYAKLDINGDFVSAHKLSGSYPYMIIDDFDNLYLTGNYIASTTDFDPGPGNTTLTGPSTQFIRKTDANSNLIWVINTGGSGNQTKPLTLDNFNNIFFSSYYQNTIDLDPSALVNNITSLGASGNNNIFISKFNTLGNFISGLSYGSAASNNELTSIIIDNNNAIISTGHYNSSQLCDFDPSAALYELTGGNNFVQKLGQCVSTTNTITPNVCSTYTAPDGATHTITGQYFATIPNFVGCDSVITINLTVNNNTTSAISPSACATYTAPDSQIYTQSGLYSATIPNFAGCDSIISIDLTINNVNTGISSNGITLSANLAGMQYEWIDCDNGNSIIPGENSQSFVATSNGNYAVIVNDGSCIDTSICMQISEVSIEELNVLGIYMYPNPSSIELNVNTLNPMIIRVYNSIGSIVYNSEKLVSNTKLDVSQYKDGIYFVRFYNSEIDLFKKIVIQH